MRRPESNCEAADRVGAADSPLGNFARAGVVRKLQTLAAGLGLAAPLALACSSQSRPAPAREGAAAEASAGSASTDLSNGGAAGEGGSAGAAGRSALPGSAGTAAAGSAGSSSFEPACIPRQNCQHLCAALGSDPANCGLGTADQCGCICETRFNGPCSHELDALLACTGDSPSIDCSTRGRIFPGCESESFALQICDLRAREQLCAQDTPACLSFCEPALLSRCSHGPADLGGCLCGCEQTLTSACPGEFDAFMTCSGSAPTFTCDSGGQTQSTTCSSEWRTLQDCSAASSASPPDAG